MNFESDGEFSSWRLQISASGVETNDSFNAFLDGKKLAWTSVGHSDRSFYTWNGSSGLEKGKHSLTFIQGTTPKNDRIRQLCSVTLHEYGNESEFRANSSSIGIYPTWSRRGIKTFRPTNDFCIMRNMLSNSFCSGKIEKINGSVS